MGKVPTTVLFIVVLVSGCVSEKQQETSTSVPVAATTSLTSTTLSTISTTLSPTSTMKPPTTTTLSPYPRNISFESIHKFSRCNKLKGSFAITSKETFKNISSVLRQDLPEIDFSKKQVLAVFYGTTALSNPIEITDIIEMEEKIIVLLDKKYPIIGGGHLNWVKNPCHLVTINKTEKPVVFIENKKYCTEDTDCVKGADEPVSYNYSEWCNPTECVNKAGYITQLERYDRPAMRRCNVSCSPCPVCKCLDNLCTVTNWTDNECC